MAKLSALLVSKGRRKADELTTALTGDDKAFWSEALQVEVDSLLSITESLIAEIPDPSVAYDIIYATVVLKKKMLDAIRVDKYKVRIALCGNQLLAKSDYNNPTYSPTVSMLVHMAMLQLSIYDNMHMATASIQSRRICIKRIQSTSSLSTLNSQRLLQLLVGSIPILYIAFESTSMAYQMPARHTTKLTPSIYLKMVSNVLSLILAYLFA